MDVFDLSQNSISSVAQLMCRIKPEWWDYEGALGQLSDINESIKTAQGGILAKMHSIPKDGYC